MKSLLSYSLMNIYVTSRGKMHTKDEKSGGRVTSFQNAFIGDAPQNLPFE